MKAKINKPEVAKAIMITYPDSVMHFYKGMVYQIKNSGKWSEDKTITDLGPSSLEEFKMHTDNKTIRIILR